MLIQSRILIALVGALLLLSLENFWDCSAKCNNWELDSENGKDRKHIVVFGDRPDTDLFSAATRCVAVLLQGQGPGRTSGCRATNCSLLNASFHCPLNSAACRGGSGTLHTSAVPSLFCALHSQCAIHPLSSCVNFGMQPIMHLCIVY